MFILHVAAPAPQVPRAVGPSAGRCRAVLPWLRPTWASCGRRGLGRCGVSLALPRLGYREASRLCRASVAIHPARVRPVLNPLDAQSCSPRIHRHTCASALWSALPHFGWHIHGSPVTRRIFLSGRRREQPQHRRILIASSYDVARSRTGLSGATPRPANRRPRQTSPPCGARAKRLAPNYATALREAYRLPSNRRPVNVARLPQPTESRVLRVT